MLSPEARRLFAEREPYLVVLRHSLFQLARQTAVRVSGFCKFSGRRKAAIASDRPTFIHT